MDKTNVMIHAIEFYSPIKRNELLTYTTAWMDCKNIRWGEKCLHKSEYTMIPFT